MDTSDLLRFNTNFYEPWSRTWSPKLRHISKIDYIRRPCCKVILDMVGGMLGQVVCDRTI